MRAPQFWDRDGLLPAVLAPAGWLYGAATAHRLRRPGATAPVPVICCGGVTAGGAGKTPLALDLAARLIGRSRSVAFLTRGYGGAARGVRVVDPAADDASQVGDEALLLAAVAPTFVSADRAASAAMAVAAGAQVLVMDDGLQNPTLRRDLSLLTIDGATGFGNRRVIPAGPLREPVVAAAGRCNAAVLIGDDVTQAVAMLPPELAVLRARLAVQPDLGGMPVLAFAGIGRPEKFFASVREAGAVPVACRRFADHHRYSDAELDRLAAEAASASARLLTTAKDAVRLSAAWRARVQILQVRLQWERPEEIERLLDTLPP